MSEQDYEYRVVRRSLYDGSVYNQTGSLGRLHRAKELLEMYRELEPELDWWMQRRPIDQWEDLP